MRLLMYLGTLAILLMALEVKASWQEFEQAQVDISPWLYEDTANFSDWNDYIILGNATSQSIKVEEKTLSSNSSAVAITQRITNISSIPYCLIVRLNQSTNTINTHLRGGRTIVLPGETSIIGGYRVKDLEKSWNMNWSFQTTKRLELCK